MSEMELKFGDKLKFYREEMNMSQEELGKEINVTRTTISNWETGKSFPDGDKLVELSKLFGITTDVLLGKEVDEDELEIFKGYLRRAGIMKNVEDITLEELKYAINYALAMKSMYINNIHINDNKENNNDENN